MIGRASRRKPARRGWSSTTLAATGWGESTFAELAWDKSRSAAARWGAGGAALGIIVGAIAFAPAAWLANGVASATGQRLLLAEARGTVWSGSAVPILTGGPGSRDAAALPGRVEWTLGLKGLGFELRARQACCLNGTVALRLRPGLGRMAVTLVPPAGWVGQWPSAWLSGLGTPFNTLQLGGSVRLVSPRRPRDRRRIVTPVDARQPRQLPPHARRRSAKSRRLAAHLDHARRRSAIERRRQLDSGRRALSRRSAGRRG